MALNIRTANVNGRNAYGFGEQPSKGKLQVMDQNTSGSRLARWWVTADTTPHSGLIGMHLEGRAADLVPIGMTLWRDATPIWDTVALDYATTDLVLAYSHTTQTDNIRMEATAGRVAIGQNVGTPTSVGQVQIYAHNNQDSGATEGAYINTWGNIASLLLTQSKAGTKRVYVAFNGYDGFRLGEDSAQNGTRDFFITNGAAGVFTYKISTADVHEIGSAVGTSAVKLVSGKFGAFNQTPVARPAAYTVTNHVARRTMDESTITLAQLANFVGTMYNDMVSLGWLQ